jgi:surfeit locus 1 family protein
VLSKFAGENPRFMRTVVVFLLIVIILISLGAWQLRRAEEKRAIEAALRERSASEPLWIGDAELQVQDNEYRRAIAKGRFDSAHTVFLDNQIHHGQAGYYVLTPLQLVRGARAILVNRGWVPMGLNRQQLPKVDTPHSLVAVCGSLRSPPQAPFFLGDEGSLQSANWPKVVQYVDVESLQAQLGYSLQPLVLQLAADEPYGFVRQWPAPPTSVHQHIAYAIQWFAMALVVVVIFVVLHRRRFDSGNSPKGKG